MFGKASKKRQDIQTLVGVSTRITGDIEFQGGLHLDGTVIGNICAENGTDAVLSISQDGLIEGTGTDGEMFGGERVARILGESGGGPRRLTEAIYREITTRQNIDELEDDISFLALRLGLD